MAPRSCLEWDFRFTLPIGNWRRASKKIRSNLAAVDWDALNVEYVMMSGVEYGKTGRDTEKSYHVHAGIVAKVPMPASELKSCFLGDEPISATSSTCIASWSQERPAAKPYRGWFIHHTKQNMKVEGSHGQPLCYEWGELPEDAKTQLNADKIMAVCREYDPIHLDREKELIQAWGVPITFKSYRVPRTDEERAAAKKAYMKLYRENPDNRKRKRDQDIVRKQQEYVDTRAKYESLPEDAEEAPELYCAIKYLEKSTWIRDHLRDAGQEPIPEREFL